MEINELVKIVKPYSMATEERLRWIATSAKRVIEENIPGDFVECGVCNGGSAAILAHFAQLGHRKLHLFDSFAGLPAIGPNDVPSVTGHPAEKEVGKCVGGYSEVMEVIGKATTGDFTVDIWKGWFHETFPKAVKKIDTIAMLNLDSDWYESERLCWETWYGKVSPSGAVYIDDYFYWPGCKQACDDFFEKYPVKPADFQKVGHSLGLIK